ncbi:unnamed protein product [Brassicogethes aeneus]|uniref:Uncharacterized protein n=1 Tax=Brassicogethes aeneus TaxID=1431903 RepID=A0A9P0FFK7_BRAAE|nr:unnamed protein product [Brassicogethes aeneus]
MSKLIYFLFFASIMVFIIYYLSDNSNDQNIYYKKYNFPTFKTKYLINTSTCKIPSLDPITKEIKKYVFKLEPMKCNQDLPVLSYVEKNNQGAFLKIKENFKSLYGKNIDCCMMNISRVVNNSKENDIRYSSCIFFENKIKIHSDTIKVVCKDSRKKEVYKNVHMVALPKNPPDVINESKFSVLLVGIDTVSRPALMRTMPKTYKYVNENYLSLKGYNKVGSNTLPNLGGMLSGKTKKQIQETCHWNDRKLDNCSFIWKNFKSQNYITGYVEDESTISTFNYYSLGFYEAPTDFYGRHYILGAEKLGIKDYLNMDYCTGPENTGERIMNAAKDFSTTYKINKYFGLFWMNSFSHDDINLPGTMDEKVLDFFTDKDFIESIEDTFVVFFSDHGFRFGDIRFTYTGWLEERMPFIFIKVPDRFKGMFAKEYSNLLSNTQKLTNPYDVYLTLQNILEIGDENYNAVKSEACPKCYSLFQEIPEHRTCDEAAVEPHMCTCTGYSPIDPKQDLVRNFSNFVLTGINDIIKASYPTTLLCNLYKLNRVYSAGMSETFVKNNENVHYVLLLIETVPEAMFEATLEISNGAVRLVGEAGRLNKYAPQSYCVDGKDLKQYCHCMSGMDYLKNLFCDYLGC